MQGQGLHLKKQTLTATGTRIKLAKRFKHRKIAAKAVITITVADATGTKRFRYKLRAGKRPHKVHQVAARPIGARGLGSPRPPIDGDGTWSAPRRRT